MAEIETTLSKKHMASIVINITVPASLKLRLRLSIWLMRLAAFVSGYTLKLAEEEKEEAAHGQP